MSYPGHLSGGSHPSSEMQSVYSTAPADWAFQTLKNNLKDAILLNIDPDKEFEVETDASHYCIAATLNQED